MNPDYPYFTIRLEADNPLSTLGDPADGPEVFDSFEDACVRRHGLSDAYPRISIFGHTESPTLSDYSRGVSV